MSWSAEVAAAGPEAAPQPAPIDPVPIEPAPIEPAPIEPAPSSEGTADTVPAPALEQPEPEPALEQPEPEPDVEAPEPEPESDFEAQDQPDEPAELLAPIRPPRFDGPYIGVLAMGTANFASVNNVDSPTTLLGAGGFLQAGDAVFPWMSIGIAAGGQAAWIRNQQMFEGALLVEFGFVPAKRYPLSIRTGFGFGGGAITQPGVEKRGGYGGALFKGSLRYEFFPLAETKRPDRGGGWAIGPELGWLGATPAGKDQPFVNTILLGLSTSLYFGS
ncbi:very large tegument protein [Enhygromyxa salina]|uniref:Very large tegument protein n=1 Tax=Enhygromyxa salina TaxID=215803 RepID=A0A0C2CMP6_9BACT|nr:hypothetical protein [Enhygromyxa salina]KIG12536.1 very large tegument protein [Enhygromyxa salina]